MMMAFNRVSNLLKLIVSWECVTAKGATDGDGEEEEEEAEKNETAIVH